MKKEEIRELARQFADALEEEKNIRVALIDLKMVGAPSDVARNLKKHDALIDSIAKLRQERMLPIIETLSAFIAEKTGTMRTPQQRLRDAVDKGKQRVSSNQLRDGMPGKAPAKKSTGVKKLKKKKTDADKKSASGKAGK